MRELWKKAKRLPQNDSKSLCAAEDYEMQLKELDAEMMMIREGVSKQKEKYKKENMEELGDEKKPFVELRKEWCDRGSQLGLFYFF